MRKIPVVVMWFLLSALISACERDPLTDPALHDLVDCDPAWGQFTDPGRCEIACAAPPPGYHRDPELVPFCDGTLVDGYRREFCTSATRAVVDGVEGCCVPISEGGVINVHFAVCTDYTP
jgi:hypothetical protein